MHVHLISSIPPHVHRSRTSHPNLYLNHSSPSQKIEHLGTVSAIVIDDNGCTLTIANSAPILGDCHIGDSIAVNGACLTVTDFDPVKEGGCFTVWLANETLQRTDLGLAE